MPGSSRERLGSGQASLGDRGDNANDRAMGEASPGESGSHESGSGVPVQRGREDLFARCTLDFRHADLVPRLRPDRHSGSSGIPAGSASGYPGQAERPAQVHAEKTPWEEILETPLGTIWQDEVSALVVGLTKEAS